jgi:hypothetical protein
MRSFFYAPDPAIARVVSRQQGWEQVHHSKWKLKTGEEVHLVNDWEALRGFRDCTLYVHPLQKVPPRVQQGLQAHNVAIRLLENPHV